MKKIIFAVIVVVISCLITSQTKSNQVKTKNFYSIDKYDGYHLPSYYKNNKKNSGIYDGLTLTVVLCSSCPVYYAWVTFEINDSDFKNAKTAKLFLHETLNSYKKEHRPANIKEYLEFVTVPTDDYQYWENYYVPKLLLAKKLIKYPISLLNRYPDDKQIVVSEDILPELKILKKGNRYITLKISAQAFLQGSVNYYSGHSHISNELRPRIEISY